jgi:hypothetical protein
MNEETAVKATAAAVKEEHVRWRHYPHLDAGLETANPTVLVSIEKRQTELERICRNGTEREKQRARAALAAYERALALYRRLVDLRDESVRAS